MAEDDLNKRIAKAQAELDAQARPPKMSTGLGASLGFRMASDFSAATIVGALLGWGLDAVFGWQPWGLISGLMLGFVTGVKLVVDQAAKANRRASGQGTEDKGDGA